MNVAKSWVDPFDDMTEEEFDDHVDKLFTSRPSTIALSLRIPPDLLNRAKRQAARAGIPYQTFIKGVLDAGVSRLERGVRSKRKEDSGLAAIAGRRASTLRRAAALTHDEVFPRRRRPRVR